MTIRELLRDVIVRVCSAKDPVLDKVRSVLKTPKDEGRLELIALIAQCRLSNVVVDVAEAVEIHVQFRPADHTYELE